MTSLQHLPNQPATHPASMPATPGQAQAFYHALLHQPDAVSGEEIGAFLQRQLVAAQGLACDLPDDLAGLDQWVAANSRRVAQRYGDYLAQRRTGGPRRFFKNRAHALYFLRHVAPSKLVDGAWLYGTLKHAADWRFHGLIRTYLEELGDGEPGLNHVVLYRNLLVEHDCSPTEPLAEELYLQGALQLGLGYGGDRFLPEVVGFNLGYEQPPLHLLITAFELNELGIDPYYFTLHVTIDNASSGHAHRAADAVRSLLPGGDANRAFIDRLRAGYRLNELGVGSTQVIEAFDLEQELVDMLERKRSFGQHMHSDYCKLEGRTVNQWLAQPGECRNFLAALETKGWIKRNQDPAQSRFWQLIEGAGAAMFGVFSGYEKQLVHDWIAGEWQAQAPQPFRARFRTRSKTAQHGLQADEPVQASPAQLFARLSPASHPTPEGLAATRLFSRQHCAQGGVQ